MDLQVLISSKKTQSFLCIKIWFNFFLFSSSFLSSSSHILASSDMWSMKLIMSLSEIPAWIFKTFIFSSDPLFINLESILIKDVFPQPVSPIIIIGIFALILNKINIILIKLSAVKTYFPTISSNVGLSAINIISPSKSLILSTSCGFSFNFLFNFSFISLIAFSFSSFVAWFLRSNIFFNSLRKSVWL